MQPHSSGTLLRSYASDMTLHVEPIAALLLAQEHSVRYNYGSQYPPSTEPSLNMRSFESLTLSLVINLQPEICFDIQVRISEMVQEYVIHNAALPTK